MHIADSLHFTVEMNTILQNNYTPIKLIFIIPKIITVNIMVYFSQEFFLFKIV